MVRCLYNNHFNEFIKSNVNAIFGALCDRYHGEALTTTREAWRAEISIMKDVLSSLAINDGENGSIVTVNANGSVTVTANAAPEGKEFKGWQINGQTVSVERSYTFNATADVTVTAVYEDVVVNPPAPNNGLSGGAIAIIVIACVLALAGGGFALYWFVIRKKKK